jgi:hypothetical protein
MVTKNEELQNTLKQYFEKEETLSSKEILNTVTLMIYNIESNSQNNDLAELARILPDKELTNLINYFDGATLKIPNKQQYKKALIYAISFYLREVKYLTWSQIKQILNLSEKEEEELKFITVSKKINKIKELLNSTALEALEKTAEEEIKSIAKDRTVDHG